MQESQSTEVVALNTPKEEPALKEDLTGEDTVSTHVLVGQMEVSKLRELSRRTRVAQSAYLREAVDDLLVKYERMSENAAPTPQPILENEPV